MKSHWQCFLGYAFLFVFSLRSKGRIDFMKFVTQVAVRNPPGNKFHEINFVVVARCCLLVCVLVDVQANLILLPGWLFETVRVTNFMKSHWRFLLGFLFLFVF